MVKNVLYERIAISSRLKESGCFKKKLGFMKWFIIPVILFYRFSYL